MIDVCSQAWTERANCKELDTNLFFITRGELIDPVAEAACEACPVKQECLNWATRHEIAGYWGGSTAREREKLRRKHNISFKSFYGERSLTYQ